MSLPNTYNRLDRVTFPSGAYIDLDIVPSNHKLEALVNDPVYQNDKRWMGTETGASYFHFTVYNNKYYWGRNGSEANGGSYVAGNHHLIYNGDNNAVILDGTTLGSGTNITASKNLWLGRRDSSTNFIGSYYYVKLTDKSNGNLVRDCVPAMRKSDSVVGLYDLINDVFYTNSGSGTLTYGTIYTGEENITFTDNPLSFKIGESLDFIAYFDRSANCRIKVNGTWKFGMMYTKVSGTWKLGTVKLKNSGTWKDGG